MRTSGGLSDVETTTTDRARPSGPRSCSRNARTSRPRSPTSASTTTSAAVPRAIMPSSVLLPTPLPPKRPTRWPRPHVSSASIARTPVPSGTLIGCRASGLTAAAIERRARSASEQRAAAVDRPAERVDHAAEQRRRRPAPTRSGRARPAARPGGCPTVSPSGTDSRCPSRNPTTSTDSGAIAGAPTTSQTSPTRACGPIDSTSRPTTRTTRPLSGVSSVCRSDVEVRRRARNRYLRTMPWLAIGRPSEACVRFGRAARAPARGTGLRRRRP